MRCLFPRAAFLLAIFFITFFRLEAFGYPSATYDYIDNGPDGRARSYRLMLPTDVPVIRGLLIDDGAQGDTRGDYSRTIFNEFLHLHGFGYVGSFNTVGNRGNVALYALIRSLTNFASQSGHKELVNAPFVFWGFSASGSYAWGYTVLFPSRTIAVCTLHAGINTNGAVAYSKGIDIPITITNGEMDGNTAGSMVNFDLQRPLGALWSISTLQGIGHTEENDSALGIPFLDHMIRLRYPPDQNPLDGPINLLPIREETGWLADNSTWKSGFTYITNYANYGGNAQAASWLPDAGLAHLYRAFGSFNKKLTITTLGGQAVALSKAVVLNPQSDIPIVVDASAFPGWTELDFYHEDTLLGTVTSGTPQFVFKNAPPGVYSFVVLGKNAQGAIATSQPALAIVKAATAPVFTFTNPAGTIDLTSPVAGGVISAPADIPLNAAITANRNPIARVDFFEGLRLLGSAVSAPYSFVWSNVSAGAYEFTAKAVDSANNCAASKPFQVSVSVPNNQPPTVTLTSPNAGGSYSYLSTIPLSANAADADGQIAKVDFFLGSKLEATVTQPPFTSSWINPPVGEYSWTAVATDNAGASTRSAPAKIKVVLPGSPPTINITTPTNNTRFAPNSTIALAATISGGSGKIEALAFYRGDILIGAAGKAPYAVNWTGVAAGTYVVIAEAYDVASGTAVSDPLIVTVAAPNVNAAPGVILTSPANGSVFDSPVDVVLSADALDNDGTVQQVDFFQGSTLLGTATSSPFTTVWKSPNPGTYSITAQATDNANAVTISKAIGVTVNAPFHPPPAVAIASPASSNLPAATPINLTASATDADGIARVDFFVGNELISSVTTPPYAFVWPNPATGTYVLNAIATDNFGATSAATPVTIIVTSSRPPINSPPTVSITSPASNANFVSPANVAIDADAADSDGSITQVDFYHDNVLLGTDSVAPYSFIWSNAVVGTYTLVAKATDNSNAVTASVPITITVNAPPNVPPTVALLAPANGASFVAPATILISADATDGDGSIRQVDLFQNNSLLVSLASAPYTFTWSNAAAGNYALTATATDNLGASSTTAPIAIAVTLPVALAIHAARVGDVIALTWTGSAVLESADSVTGPWASEPGGAGNAFTASATVGSKFYRLRQ